MKKYIFIFALIPLISCLCENTAKLKTEKIIQQDYYSDNDSINAINTQFEYFHLDSSVSNYAKINATIDLTIFSKLGVMDTIITSYQAYYDSIKIDFLQLRQDLPNALSINYEHICNGEMPIQKNKIISFYMENYIYSGGAHGMDYHEFLNFNEDTGELIDITETIADLNKFKQIAEQKLRQKLNMSGDDRWSDFTFVEDFALPKNIGLTEKGYRLIYNPYEILSYAQGHTELFIAFDEL